MGKISTYAPNALAPLASAALGVINVEAHRFVPGQPSDDTATLRRALAAVAGGGMLHFSRMYDVTIDATTQKGIPIPSNVSLVGAGSHTGVRLANGAAQANVQNAVLVLAGSANVALHNLVIDANKAGNASQRTSCIELLSNCVNIDLAGLVLREANTLAGFTGGYGVVAWHGGARDVRLSRCHFENNGQSDMQLAEGANWAVGQCTSRNTGYVPINIETLFNSGTGQGSTIRGIVVDDWVAVQCGAGVATVIQNQGGVCAGVTLDNIVARTICQTTNIGGVRIRGTERTTLGAITIDGCASHGVMLDANDTRTLFACVDLSLGVIKVANITGVGNRGISLIGTATHPVRGLVIDEAAVRNTPGRGISLQSCEDVAIKAGTRVHAAGEDGINLNSCARVQMGAVNSRGNVGRGIVASSCTYIDMLTPIVTNNGTQGIRVDGASNHYHIRGATSTDDRASGKTQTFGVYLASTIVDPVHSVTDSMLRGNVTGALFRDGVSVTNAVTADNLV
jgi:hypothetical protein